MQNTLPVNLNIRIKIRNINIGQYKNIFLNFVKMIDYILIMKY